MEKLYTSERNTQILISLMKFHGVKKVVASPGTTNLCLVGSLQHDPFFEIYSSVDERSAAYIACGLARESGEPVALSCTGATASRNYVPGLTEAYYSNLPILAITSTQHTGRVGQLMEQVIDRSNPMNDIARKSVQANTVHTEEDVWALGVAINDALLEMRRGGGGPVHINLETTYSKDFSVKELPAVKGICRITATDDFPSLDGKRILVYYGAHVRWTPELTKLVDKFCEKYDAAVMCEHISNYFGEYGVYPTLLTMQGGGCTYLNPDVMIHMGTVSGFGAGVRAKPKTVWRVHPDGEVRDTFRKLTAVFEMEEKTFFQKMLEKKTVCNPGKQYYKAFHDVCVNLEKQVPDLPFSNAWMAYYTRHILPEGCELHLGILNTLRCWSLFEVDRKKRVEIYSNTGGYGIDGLVSTLLGSSLANPKKLYVGIIGDLAFFYDMNALGNRHVAPNMRLMIVNNGRGTEFRNFNHPAERFGEEADAYMAAAGHYGCQSRDLVKHYAQDLGFEYMSASNKEEYLSQIDKFLTKEQKKKPMVFEVFTDSKDESDALKILYNMDVPATENAKKMIKTVLGDKGVDALKKIIKK